MLLVVDGWPSEQEGGFGGRRLEGDGSGDEEIVSM